MTVAFALTHLYQKDTPVTGNFVPSNIKIPDVDLPIRHPKTGEVIGSARAFFQDSEIHIQGTITDASDVDLFGSMDMHSLLLEEVRETP